MSVALASLERLLIVHSYLIPFVSNILLSVLYNNDLATLRLRQHLIISCV